MAADAAAKRRLAQHTSTDDQMRRVDFCVLFERAARELDVATALAYILSRRHGLTTEVVQQYHARATIFGRIFFPSTGLSHNRSNAASYKPNTVPNGPEIKCNSS